MNEYLAETPMLDFSHPAIQRLVEERRWRELGDFERIRAIYGFGVAVADLHHPVIDFDRNDTYIQSEGINQDFGAYGSPDELLLEHRQEMSALKAFAYRNLGRRLMNANVRKVRDAKRQGREVIVVENVNKRFSQGEEALLERAKGSRLLSIDAVLAAPPDNSWNTVRLHFDGFDIDVNNYLHNVVVDEFGSLEEFGLLSVAEASEETLSIPEVGVDTTVMTVDSFIDGVTVVNDIAEIYGDGKLVAKLEYPQAIAFHAESGVIMLDKEVWFSELLVIKKGDRVDDLLYDESVNWEDDPEEDPTTHFEFCTEAQEL